MKKSGLTHPCKFCTLEEMSGQNICSANVKVISRHSGCTRSTTTKKIPLFKIAVYLLVCTEHDYSIDDSFIFFEDIPHYVLYGCH